jgi:hypothetical protein
VEVSEAAEIPDPPNSAPSRRILLLVIAHLIIAILPVTLGVVTLIEYSLAYLWAISSIPFAQIMLLAMWIGLAQGMLVRKLAVAGLSVVYLVFWHALGTQLMYRQSRLAEIFIQDCIQMLAILAVLSGVMFCMRRLLGQIRHFNDPELLDTSAQTRYSLFTILSLTTVGSVFMAMFRISIERSEPLSSTAVIAHIILMMTTFSLLLVSTIWAALAPGIVRYRIMAIAVLAVLLGVSLAVSAGHTPAQGGWLMLAAATSIVVVPAAIVCGSLLFLRGGGYRLVKTPAEGYPSATTN